MTPLSVTKLANNARGWSGGKVKGQFIRSRSNALKSQQIENHRFTCKLMVYAMFQVYLPFFMVKWPDDMEWNLLALFHFFLKECIVMVQTNMLMSQFLQHLSLPSFLAKVVPLGCLRNFTTTDWALNLYSVSPSMLNNDKNLVVYRRRDNMDSSTSEYL